jgi:hypothetical protein
MDGRRAGLGQSRAGLGEGRPLGPRHRPLLAGTAVLLVASVIGLGVGTVLLGRANARTDAERRRAEAARAQAEENFRKARQAVDDYLTKVSESKLLNVPGLQPLRKELLDSARAYYEGFLRQRADDPGLRAEAGPPPIGSRSSRACSATRTGPDPRWSRPARRTSR